MLHRAEAGRLGPPSVRPFWPKPSKPKEYADGLSTGFSRVGPGLLTSQVIVTPAAAFLSPVGLRIRASPP